MNIKQYLICFAAIGIFSGCGDSNIPSNDSSDTKILTENDAFSDLELVRISDPWNMEKLDLRQTKADAKPVLLYYNGFASVNSRYFEDRVLSAENVLSILQKYFTIFDIKSDDQTIYRLIKASGDTLKEPKSEWWKSYQLDRYGVFESPFCDIVNYENESLVEKQMNYRDADPITFENWLVEGVDSYRRKELIKNQTIEIPNNDIPNFSQHIIQTQADFDYVLALSDTLYKPILVHFSGLNSASSRPVEDEIWSDPVVYPLLKDQYLIATIYVDDRTKLPNGVVNDSAKTWGEYWTNYEIKRYNMLTQPVFDIVNCKNMSLVSNVATYRTHGNAELYRAWLEEGLSNFHN